MDRPPVPVTHPEPVIIGWLLVLCLVPTFACPASLLYQMFAHTGPALLNTHDLKHECFPGVAAFSFAAGVRLWMIKPGAVRFAKRFWLAFLCAHLGYFGFCALLVRPIHLSSVAPMAWNHLAGSLLPYLLWTTTLDHSKRVRETYALSD
jgi:hypothetical protein